MEWLQILLSSEQLEASVSKITLPFGG
jgi:hypothetical protein